MARRYSSFVLRCWLLESGERRITIEHIQSRARFESATIAEALVWMDARSGSSSADGAGGDTQAPAPSPDVPTE